MISLWGEKTAYFGKPFTDLEEKNEILTFLYNIYGSWEQVHNEDCIVNLLFSFL